MTDIPRASSLVLVGREGLPGERSEMAGWLEDALDALDDELGWMDEVAEDFYGEMEGVA